MSPGEKGMFLIMLLCMVFTVVTILTANKRIYEEQRKARFYQRLYRNRNLQHPNCRCTVAPIIEESKR